MRKWELSGAGHSCSQHLLWIEPCLSNYSTVTSVDLHRQSIVACTCSVSYSGRLRQEDHLSLGVGASRGNVSSPYLSWESKKINIMVTIHQVCVWDWVPGLWVQVSQETKLADRHHSETEAYRISFQREVAKLGCQYFYDQHVQSGAHYQLKYFSLLYKCLHCGGFIMSWVEGKPWDSSLAQDPSMSWWALEISVGIHFACFFIKRHFANFIRFRPH